MTAEQLLIEAWRRLPAHRQQEVLDFTQFLAQYSRDRSGAAAVGEPVSEPNYSQKVLRWVTSCKTFAISSSRQGCLCLRLKRLNKKY